MRLIIEQIKGSWMIAAHEEDRRIALGGGATVKEAARWLVHHVNRIAEATESAVLAAGLMTEDEITEAAGDGNGENAIAKLVNS